MDREEGGGSLIYRRFGHKSTYKVDEGGFAIEVEGRVRRQDKGNVK